MNIYSRPKLLLGALLVFAWLDSVHAESPGALLAEAIEQGKMPPWANAGARAEWKFYGLTVVTCLESRDRTKRWVTHGPWWKYLNWQLTGNYTFGPAEDVLPEHWAVCGWPYPGHTGPVALGEPAYLSIVCKYPCADGEVNWTLTNREQNIAGATIKGEPCGEELSGEPAGWFVLPRLSDPNGFAAVTRCSR